MNRWMLLGASLFITPFATTGCEHVAGDGNVVARTEAVAPFERVSLEGVGDVVVERAEAHEVTIHIDENLQGYVRVSGAGNELRVETAENVSLDPTDFVVIVRGPTTAVIAAEGTGDVRVAHEGGDLALDLDGTGDVRVAHEGGDLALDLDGTGDVRLEGIAHTAVLDAEGTGDVEAATLDTATLHVELEGVGDVALFARERLDGEVSGAGDIRIHGHPASYDLDTDGTGDVVHEP
jgi:hypothetical protein